MNQLHSPWNWLPARGSQFLTTRNQFPPSGNRLPMGGRFRRARTARFAGLCNRCPISVTLDATPSPRRPVLPRQTMRLGCWTRSGGPPRSGQECLLLDRMHPFRPLGGSNQVLILRGRIPKSLVDDNARVDGATAKGARHLCHFSVRRFRRVRTRCDIRAVKRRKRRAPTEPAPGRITVSCNNQSKFFSVPQGRPGITQHFSAGLAIGELGSPARDDRGGTTHGFFRPCRDSIQLRREPSTRAFSRIM